MTSRSVLLAFAGALLLALDVAASKARTSAEPAPHKGAPFVMCPSGKAAELIGGLRYDGPSALAFDSRNRPYLFDTRDADKCGAVTTLRDGTWRRLSYIEAIRKARPKFTSFLATPRRRHLHALGTMTIDDADGLYAIVDIVEGAKRAPVLIYSPDLGGSFQVYDLPGEPTQAFLEIRVGHNDMSGPPAIGLLKFRKAHPARWTAYHDLSVTAPVRKGRRLELPPAAHVTADCFGISNHSGGCSFAVTTGKRTHLVFGEIPAKATGGNPTYAATYDRERRKIVAKQFLVTAPPRGVDVHSTPVIAVDGRGVLHVVAGAHGQRFLYLRSLKPDRIDAGWTKPAPVGTRQTYATLLCDKGDRLHSFFRQWRSTGATLSYQAKPAAADAWPTSVTLVRSPLDQKGYGIFYHRVFFDRAGAIYVSFTFNAQKGGTYPRALIVSEDGGRTWRLATTRTFARRTRKASR
jgi:hypothetical protein